MDSMVASASTSKHYITACSSFVFACLLAITLRIFFFSPISPDLLELPLPSSPTLFPSNSQLQKVIKLGEGFVDKAEDVAVDKNGVLYTATRDGWIKRMHRNGTWENWRMIDNRDSLLGITITAAGDLIVCDAEEGLLKVGEDGMTVLASYVNGSKIRFAEDAIEASDGSIYFTVGSTKFSIHDWYLEVLEAKPHGQLLKYNPSSNETSILLDDLCFANGIALSPDQDYLVVCETWKFRCLKYWLKEENRGKREIFIDNLPGGPDNINLAPDGSFWIALVQLTSSGLEFVHNSKASKYLLAAFPQLHERVSGISKKAMVVNVANDGKIKKMFDDPNGKVMPFVTSALEFEDHLYLGSLKSDFIGKLPLKTA